MRRATGLGLFVLFQALYALTSSGNAFRIPDEFEVYFQTEHLIDAGDLSVPQAQEIRAGNSSIFFGRVGVDGKPYAPYGPLAAVLAVPHHLVGRALASVLGIERVPRAQGLAWVIVVGGVTMLATATAAALTIVGFHRACIALGTAADTALLLSLLLGGASVLWPYGTSFFSEAFLAAAFTWAAVLLIEARSAARAAPPLVAAAMLILIAGLTKVTSLMVAPAFVAAILAERSIALDRRWRAGAIIGAAITVAAALQLGWNVYRFGTPFEFGYDWSETIPVGPARAFAIEDVPRGIAVLLFTPGKSLFLWAPILVLALLNAGACWRRDRALAVAGVTALVIGLVAYGAYMFPEGGYAHGPRHLVPIVPLLALMAAGPASRAHSRPLIYACGAIGFVMALLATSVSYLEDQALRRDSMGRPVPGYYEVIEPAQGRPSNRYRFDHIPFISAMSRPGWSQSPILGQGPDYFFKHLQQARAQLSDGQSIPAALPWAWPLFWGVVALGAALALVRPGEAALTASPTTRVDATLALSDLPLIRALERGMPLIVIALSGVLLASELDQGWVPYDEGTLGQAAERVLAGQVPHRDYDDVYTGGLAYLHAAFFSVGTHSSSTLRAPLFLLALPWVAALYAIVRRFVPPIGAALVTVTAVVWSVPNYPASMPSWFNLFFATFGALALLRGLDSGRRRWFVLAGVAGGISFLFKLPGIFYLLGGGIALIATSLVPKPRDVSAGPRTGTVLVAAILTAVFVTLAVPITRAGTAEMARFLLPLGTIFVALIWREWKHGNTTALERGRALFETLGPFVLGALVPLTVWLVFLLSTGALSQTIDGVLVKPFRRIDSALMHPPPASELIYAIGLGVAMAISASRRVAPMIAVVVAGFGAAVIYSSGSNPRIYAMGVLTAWGLPLLAAAGAAWLLTVRGNSRAPRATEAAVAITTIACATLLVEFPFAAPSYLFYSFPLSLVAVAAVVGAAGRAAKSLQLVVVTLLLVFGIVRVNPGTHESFGFRFVETDETVRMKLPRSRLRVRAADAARYEALIAAVQTLAPGRTLWAGPEAPEVYFLSGVPNQTRTLFDFLDNDAGTPLVERIRATGATLVVLKLQTEFSPAPDQTTVDALRAAFPNVRGVPGFLVFWQ